MEEYVINAVSALTKDSSFADHTYFRGKAMSLIKNVEMEVLRSIYHTKKFGSFTKMMYQDSMWIDMSIGQTDSLIEAFIEEMRLCLPDDIDLLPTSTTQVSRIGDWITDSWIYTDKDGNPCELKVFFINEQLRHFGFYIHYK